MSKNGNPHVLGRNMVTAKHIIADLASHADEIEHVCIVALDKQGGTQVLMDNQPVGNIALAAAILQDKALAPMRAADMKRQVDRASAQQLRNRIGDPRTPADR